MGNALSIKERYKESIKYFAKALKVDPYNAEAFYNLGNSQFMAKEYEDALASYESCEKLGGGSSQLSLLKARVLMEIEINQQMNLEKAQKIMETLKKEEEENENIYFVYGNLMEKKNDLKEAKEYYEVYNYL